MQKSEFLLKTLRAHLTKPLATNGDFSRSVRHILNDLEDLVALQAKTTLRQAAALRIKTEEVEQLRAALAREMTDRDIRLSALIDIRLGAEKITLVDGHNFLFANIPRYCDCHADRDRRKAAVHDIATRATSRERIWIVFDGATRSHTTATSYVRVSYSGGTGEHRADRMLEKIIRAYKDATPVAAITLVSNDTDLAATARRLGATTQSVLDFTGTLPS